LEARLKVGIIGLPQVGKTTVFNLLTAGEVDVSSWSGQEAHVGVAKVPDARVDRLADLFTPRKTTYATVEYVDLPALSRREGESSSMASYLTSLKNADAMLHVVRAFDQPGIPHSEGSLDPKRDVEIVELEMVLWDLSIVGKRLERLEKDLKKARTADLEAEAEILRRFKETLEGERPLRDLELTPEEHRRVRGFTFLSAKPLLVVLNLGDGDAAKVPNAAREFALSDRAAAGRVAVMAVCGKIEAEIARLPEEDARLFRADLGLVSSGLERIIQESYSLLGLVSFYTAGEPEVRAWTIPRGTIAPQAAGVIHSDFERGFIKAEVVSFDDMVSLGSFAAARSRGLLRLEGKDYVVQENDVILFRFNL
jgi:GTP-binding protein YchF